MLQYDYAVSLDFGGLDSQGAASAIARAQKAGTCLTIACVTRQTAKVLIVSAGGS